MKGIMKTSKLNYKGLKTSLKYDAQFAEKLNKVCGYHAVDKSKVFRTLVELEYERIERFRKISKKIVDKHY